MNSRLKRLKMAAVIFSAVTLFVFLAWITAPEEPQQEQYRTNPYIVIGIPATAAVAAWIVFFVCKIRTD